MTRRLLLSYLMITALVLAMLEIPLAVVYGQREEERFLVAAERDAVVLASFVEDALEVGIEPDPTAALEYAQRTRARIVAVDLAGISLLDTDAGLGRDFSTRSEIADALSGTRSAGTRPSKTLGRDLVYVAVPVASGGTVHGALRVTVDAHEVTERTRRFWVGLAVMAAVVLLTVTAVGWGTARSVSRPLRSLRDSADRFAGGDLTPAEVSPGSPSDVRSLGQAMNAMAARLDTLIGSQRSFVSDASHQLRTPLTAVRLRLENLHSQLRDDADRVEVEAAVSEIERLTALVNGLLQLARTNEGVRSTPIDAAAIAADRVDTWTALAAESGVTLQLVAPGGPVPVRAVPGAIEQLLDNTIDNALAVSPDGGVIVVRITARQPGMTELSVSDDGPGLDDEQKRRATDRFWRGDHSVPGTGLGLAIAASLVESCGGTLDLRDSATGGLRVVFSLPAANAAELAAH